MDRIMYKQVVLLFLCLFFVSIFFAGTIALAQPSIIQSTSPLLLLNPAHEAECSVANVSDNNIQVTVEIVSTLSIYSFTQDTDPNDIFSVSEDISPSSQYFCRISYNGKSDWIRAAARELSTTASGNLVLQRAEAR